MRARVEDHEDNAFLSHTGRLEFLSPHVTKLLLRPVPKRRFSYEVVIAYDGMTPVIIDSRLPNRLLLNAFRSGIIPELKCCRTLRPEATVHDSRLDFKGENKRDWYIEVKGVTVQKNGTAVYPDAPTERGRKHLRTLISLARRKGSGAMIFFLVMRNDVHSLAIDDEIDKEFSALLEKARKSGVKVRCYLTEIRNDSAKLTVPLRLVSRAP